MDEGTYAPLRCSVCGKLSSHTLHEDCVYKLQNQLTAQRAIIREMGKALDSTSLFLFRIIKDLLHSDSIKFGAGTLSHGINELLNRTDVKDILKEDLWKK